MATLTKAEVIAKLDALTAQIDELDQDIASRETLVESLRRSAPSRLREPVLEELAEISADREDLVERRDELQWVHRKVLEGAGWPYEPQYEDAYEE